jgi:hypothetical protein
MYEEERRERPESSRDGHEKERDRSVSASPRRRRDLSFQELPRPDRVRRAPGSASGRPGYGVVETESEDDLEEGDSEESVAGGSRQELIGEGRVGSEGKGGICCSPWRSFMNKICASEIDEWESIEGLFRCLMNVE